MYSELVEFHKVDHTSMHELYRVARTDPWWPRSLQEFSDLNRWIDSWDLKSWFGEGTAELILKDQVPVGYCTLVRVDHPYTPRGVRAIECGTFLIDSARGGIVNRAVKEHLIDLAIHQFDANCLVYIVDCDNARARRALQKLPFPLEEVMLSMSKHEWYQFLNRRRFEESVDVVLFVQKLY